MLSTTTPRTTPSPKRFGALLNDQFRVAARRNIRTQNFLAISIRRFLSDASLKFARLATLPLSYHPSDDHTFRAKKT